MIRPLLLTLFALFASSVFAQTTLLPTTVSGGTGTVSAIQANDLASYSVAKGQTATIGGFGAFGGAIQSVYLFLEYTPASNYAGTGAVRVNGVDTPIMPAAGDRTRSAFLDITGGSYGIDTSQKITSLSVTFNNNGSGGQAGPIVFDYVYLVINPTLPIHMPPTWSEEFEGSGPPDPAKWTLEQGYQRNNELQYYMTSGNAWRENGNLVIEARREPMGGYEYTSASLRSAGKYSWKYGRAQIRAKIPALAGMWPAIWQVGDVGEWPSNGECDIMEFYQNKILANCAVGTDTRWVAKWDTATRSMASLESVDSNWRNQWHVWTIQWDEDNVRLYCDNILMNTTPQSWLVNTTPRGGAPVEPFKQPHNIWLNLAVGGAGGDPSNTTFPQRYHVDYWRVWEGYTTNSAPTDIHLSANQVVEGLPVGTVVGNLSVTDPDPAEVIRYTLVSGSGSTHNSQFSIPGFQSDNTDTLVLKTNSILNYADGATRSIRVRATDIEGATFEKVLTIQVNTSSTQSTVTYHGNGHTGGMAPVDPLSPYENGSTVTVLGAGTLEKTGHSFAGWNTSSVGNGTGYLPGETFVINVPTALYAQWSPNTYTVTFDANGGSTASPTSKSVTFGSTYGTLATTTRADYTFNGWFTQPSGGTQVIYSTPVSIASGHTLYAQWNSVASGITLQWDHNGDGTPSDGGSRWASPSYLNRWWNGSSSQNWTNNADARENAVFGFGGAGGTLSLAADSQPNPIYVGNITFNNFTGAYNMYQGNLNFNGVITVNNASTGRVHFDNTALSGTGSIVLNNGILSLRTGLNYTGTTTVNGGTLWLVEKTGMSAGSAFTVNNGVNLKVDVAATQFNTGLSGAGSLGGLLAGTTSGNNSITYNGTIGLELYLRAVDSGNFAGSIGSLAGGGSVGNLTISSAAATNVLTLSGNNTYTGATTITGCTLVLTGATQATSAVTFTSNGKLGLNTGFPVTAANAAVNLTNGTISITGSTVAPSYTLLTAASITGTPVLTTPIEGYELQVVGGTQLRLVSFNADITPPALTSITNDTFGAPIAVNTPVIYTLTFSEDINEATVEAADFSNAGSAMVTIETITEASPGVFTVELMPTSAGTLQLQINAGAIITDPADNALDTTEPIVDDTIITVVNPIVITLSDYANADIPVSGTLHGNYTATHASDYNYQTISEILSGGEPGSRYSYLEHKWSFHVTGGTTVTFHVEAHHTANSENDHFTFAYSTTGADGPYTDMLTVTKTSADNTPQSYSLPAGTSGTVHVRVIDSNRTPGNENTDTLYIDEMVFVSGYGSQSELVLADEQTWKTSFGTADLSDFAADFDGDGLSNGEERIWGLDPTRGDSSTPVVALLDPAAMTFRYTRRDPARTGKTFTVWTSSDLVNWTHDTAAIQLRGPMVNAIETVEVTLAAQPVNGRLFVRVHASD